MSTHFAARQLACTTERPQHHTGERSKPSATGELIHRAGGRTSSAGQPAKTGIPVALDRRCRDARRLDAHLFRHPLGGLRSLVSRHPQRGSGRRPGLAGVEFLGSPDHSRGAQFVLHTAREPATDKPAGIVARSMRLGTQRQHPACAHVAQVVIPLWQFSRT